MFKPGIKIRGIQPELVVALTVAYTAFFSEYGHFLLFSSIAEQDPVHSAKSLHYDGRAFDISGTNFSGNTQMLYFSSLLKKLLTDEFDVVLESDHIHVEFQPKVK